MKISYAKNKQEEKLTISANDIPVSTVFSGKLGGMESVFLRVYKDVIDLANSHNTWEPRFDLRISDYQPLDVELLVLGNLGCTGGNDA